MRSITLWLAALVGWILADPPGPDTIPVRATASRPASVERIRRFHLQAPRNAHEIEQASDVCYGRIGGREGLWIACDRNGGPSAGRIYFIARGSLDRARDGGDVVADECFTIVPPRGDWFAFVKACATIDPLILDDLRERIRAGLGEGDAPFLDLEAIAIAPALTTPGEPHLFVAVEEPYSAILELELEGNGANAKGCLVGVYLYPEAEDEHGVDCNDGLEGLAWAGRPGEFYWAEEGTRPHDNLLGQHLFFLDPRLGHGRLQNGRLEIETRISGALTRAVRELRQAASQTVNALSLSPAGHLLAIDRNGGWILLIDPASGRVERHLNLYDLGGVNLRRLLADFPHPRNMPYISIEGIAADPAGNLWLVDDPALPETYHASCLIELIGMSPDVSRPFNLVRPPSSQP